MSDKNLKKRDDQMCSQLRKGRAWAGSSSMVETWIGGVEMGKNKLVLVMRGVTQRSIEYQNLNSIYPDTCLAQKGSERHTSFYRQALVTTQLGVNSQQCPLWTHLLQNFLPIRQGSLQLLFLRVIISLENHGQNFFFIFKTVHYGKF